MRLASRSCRSRLPCRLGARGLRAQSKRQRHGYDAARRQSHHRLDIGQRDGRRTLASCPARRSRPSRPTRTFPAGDYTFNVNLAGAATTRLHDNQHARQRLGLHLRHVRGDVERHRPPADRHGADQRSRPATSPLRLANASPTAGGIDVYLTAPGADLNTAAPFMTGMVYGTSSAFVNVPLGNYQLRLTRTGTKQVIFDAPHAHRRRRYRDRRWSPTAAAARSSSTSPCSRPAAQRRSSTTGSHSSRRSTRRRLPRRSIYSSTAPHARQYSVHRLLELPGGRTPGTRTITVEAAATPGATLLTTSPTLDARDRHVDRPLRQRRLARRARADRRERVDAHGEGAGPLRQRLAGSAVARRLRQRDAGRRRDSLQNSASGYALLDAVADGTSYQFDFDPRGHHDSRSHVAGSDV